MHAETVNQALKVLQAGGIVAMPTDTVYGLHCDPHHLATIEKILHLKQRSPNKGLILIADRLERFNEYIQALPDEIDAKLRNNPGITWIVPAAKNISRLITGNFNTVAIRISPNPLIAQLTASLNSPIISTSANISTQAVAKNKAEIITMFPAGIDLIIEGELPQNAKASEIRDAFTDERFR